MSSSGVIYAIIVGAWAVYLVPMWLRREDELNRARETQRYAAAIKVLAHKEAFERRWAQSDEADQALPLAAGQGFVPAAGTAKRAAAAGPGAKVKAGAAEPWTPGPVRPSASTSAKSAASASSANGAVRAAASGKAAATVTASVGGGDGDGVSRAPRTETATKTAPAAAKYPGPRTGLMARRRRVVGTLFTLSTLGALVSADLGAGYLWTMALPAVLLSVYIVRLRRDERIRAAARARRRAAAQLAREARDAELQAREEARARDAHALAEAQAEADAYAHAQAAAEAEQQRRTQAARRRSSAAGRSRAQAYVQETPELPRASNG
jgi:hypothetical protein